MIASTSRKIKGGSALHRAHPPYLIPAQQSPIRLAQSLERTAVLVERDAELTLDRLLRRVEDRLHRLEELAAIGRDLEKVRPAVGLVRYALDEPRRCRPCTRPRSVVFAIPVSASRSFGVIGPWISISFSVPTCVNG